MAAVSDDELPSLNPSDARQTMLNALDSIAEIEDEMGAEVRHLAVVYSVVKKTTDDDGDTHVCESGGWNHTTDPDWVVAALLRKVATALEDSPNLADDDED
jgi:hypothetical protein